MQGSSQEGVSGRWGIVTWEGRFSTSLAYNAKVAQVPAKKLVAVRLAESGLAIVDEFARQEKLTRSDMIRILLGEAVRARMAGPR